MTKKQKIWLYVFLGMVIVPELLWSPVGNYVYELTQLGKVDLFHPFRNNFVVSSGSGKLYSIVLLIQLLGILLVFLDLILFGRLIKNKLFYIVLFLINLALIALIALIFYFVAIFNPRFP